MSVDTERLRTFLAKATAGTWARRSDGDEQVSIVTLGEFLPIGRFASAQDAAAVVEAMNAIGGLLDEVERLKEGIKKAEGAIVEERDWPAPGGGQWDKGRMDGLMMAHKFLRSSLGYDDDDEDHDRP